MNKSKIRTAFTIFPIAIILLASAFSIACDSAEAPRVAANAPKTIPPRDPSAIESASVVEINKLDGSNFKLSDFRGKVLVLDFWATYCPPCVRQVPLLAELSRKYRDKGVEVVGLTADDKADQEQVVAFLKKAGADYTVGYDNQWVSSAFLKNTENELRVIPIPQLFVISRDGRVVEHLIGDTPERGIEYVEQVVKEQLALK